MRDFLFPWFVLATVGVVGACGDTVTATDASPADAADVADAVLDAADDAADASVDAPRDVPADLPADAPADASDARDVATDGGCAAPGALAALRPSTECSARPLRGEIAALCGTLAPCPVTNLTALDCPGGGYGPWAAHDGAGGTSVVFTTNSGGFVTRLFTLRPGDVVRADDAPFMTSASNAFAVDRAGVRYLVAGEMPGVIRHRETGAGWVPETAVPGASERDLMLVSDAVVVDEAHTFVAYQPLSTNALEAAVRGPGCWSRVPIAPSGSGRTQVALDATDRPWYSYWESGPTGWRLMLRDPDGAARQLAVSGGSIDVHEEATLLPGGLDGRDARPAVLARGSDGALHLHAPGAAGAYTDLALPAAVAAAQTGDCPTGGPPGPGGRGCGGLTTCSQRVAGPLGTRGVARTGDGALYVSRLYGDYTTDYSLREMCGGAGCACAQEATATRGSTELRLQRVTAASVDEVLRLTVSRVGPAASDRMPLLARGATLTAVIPVGNTAGATALRAVEIDTARLPR